MPVAAAAQDRRCILRLWYETSLPRLIGTHHIELVFSQTNYLPSRRLKCPTLLLVQNAGHFSEVFRTRMASESHSALQRIVFHATGRWVRRSVGSATRVTVQTAALATEILTDVRCTRRTDRRNPSRARTDGGPAAPLISGRIKSGGSVT